MDVVPVVTFEPTCQVFICGRRMVRHSRLEISFKEIKHTKKHPLSIHSEEKRMPLVWNKGSWNTILADIHQLANIDCACPKSEDC